MDSPVYSHTPLFNTIRDLSTEYMAKAKEGTASSSSPHHFVPDLSDLTTQQQQQLYSILSNIRIFSFHIIQKLAKSISILHPSVPNEGQQQTDAATVLKVLKRHMDSITHFTNEYLESIGREASEFLNEVTKKLQALEKELEEAKVLARFYNAIFSALVMLVAALLAPISTLAVAPFLQRFDPVLDDVIEKRILDKLKVFSAFLFKIHFAIAKAGKIQDAIHGLSDMVTDFVYADGSAFNYSKMKPFEGDATVICPVLCIANGLNDFKFNSMEGKGKAVMGLSSSSSSSSYSPVVVNDSNDFSKMRDAKLEGKVVFVDLEEKVVVVDDPGALKEEGQLQEARFIGPLPILEIADATKRLLEVEKAMAAAMTKVEMAEHELSQLIQSLALTL